MPTANVATLDTQGEFVTDTNPVLGANSASFIGRPPWQPPPNSNLQWTWIENSGPFITNGQSSHP